MKVIVDATRCQGHGRCYAISPQVFLADEQGMSTTIDGPWTPERIAQAAAGARNCPERAITIADSPAGA